MSTPASTRLSHAKRREPDLDPVQPLKAARARRDAHQDAIKRQRGRENYQRQVGQLVEILVYLLHQAKLGTPRPIIMPQPIRRDNVFQVTTPTRPMRDWRRVLPVPDLPRPKPVAKAPAPVNYQTIYRSARNG